MKSISDENINQEKGCSRQISTPKQETPISDSRQTRRQILQMFGGAGLLSVLAGTSGCTEDLTLSFSNNFDYYKYQPFSEEDLVEIKKRDERAIGPEDCYYAVQQAWEKEMPFPVNVEDLLEFSQTGDVIEAKSKIETADQQSAFMAKYPQVIEIKPFRQDLFPFSYELVTADDSILFQIHEGRLNINYLKSGANINMFYDTFNGTFQSTERIKRYLRTVTIRHKDSTYRYYTNEPGSGVLEQINEGGQYYSSPESEQIDIHNAETLEKFLRNIRTNAINDICFRNIVNQNDGMRDSEYKLPPVEQRSFNMFDLKDINQLIDIFRMIPADPQMYAVLISSALEYRLEDKAAEDEYRHPVETLRSGWADCDDYAVINYFWAYLHGFNPHMVVIHSSDKSKNHVFVHYQAPDGQQVFLDNSNARVLDSQYTIEKYLEKYGATYEGGRTSDDYIVDYNGPV